jgi:Ca2+-binding RTX toxin-like protein
VIIGDNNNYPHYYGIDGNDYIEGGSWNDRINGGPGNNTLIGNDGNDIFFLNEGENSVNGGKGNDTVSYEGYRGYDYYITVIKEMEMRQRHDLLPLYDNQQFVLEEADDKTGLIINLALGTSNKNDQFILIEGIIGSHYNDLIHGDDNSNTLVGLDGNDTIYSGSGDDQISCGLGISSLFGENGNDIFLVKNGMANCDGGEGNDAGDFANYHSGLQVNMREGYIIYNDNERYHFSNIESIRTTAYGDLIEDSAGNDEIHSGDGNDTINLSSGYDAIDAGPGNDDIILNGTDNKFIWCGPGRDKLIITNNFNTPSNDSCIIADFKNDLIDLSMISNICNINDITIRYDYDVTHSALVELNTNQTIVLLGVSNLTIENFLFLCE